MMFFGGIPYQKCNVILVVTVTGENSYEGKHVQNPWQMPIEVIDFPKTIIGPVSFGELASKLPLKPLFLQRISMLPCVNSQR